MNLQAVKGLTSHFQRDNQSPVAHLWLTLTHTHSHTHTHTHTLTHTLTHTQLHKVFNVHTVDVFYVSLTVFNFCFFSNFLRGGIRVNKLKNFRNLKNRNGFPVIHTKKLRGTLSLKNKREIKKETETGRWKH